MSRGFQAPVAGAARARSGRAHVSRVGGGASTLFGGTAHRHRLSRPAAAGPATRLLRGGCDVVLSPAEDGGYALIGARRVSWRLFDGIAWGEGGVYAQTAERLRALGYRWRALCR